MVWGSNVPVNTRFLAVPRSAAFISTSPFAPVVVLLP